MSDSVAVVVLNWNGCAETLACLASLEQQVDVDFELIVVDNGSTDDSRSAIGQLYPSVTLISTGKNLGFAGGNNVALRYVLEARRSSHILILNNDTWAPPQLVSTLVQAARRAGERSVISPVILDSKSPPGVWYNGARWDSRTCAFELDSHEYDPGQEIVETQIVTGCALFAATDAFREIGLFDERLFLMHEESDWCFRAGRAGYRFFVARSVALTHLVSVSFGGARSPLQTYFDVRNRLYFAQWNLSKAQLATTFIVCLKNIVADACDSIPWAPPPEHRSSLRRWYWAWRTDRQLPVASGKSVLQVNPQVRAQLAGLMAYVARRTGDCPSYIRSSGSTLRRG